MRTLRLLLCAALTLLLVPAARAEAPKPAAAAPSAAAPDAKAPRTRVKNLKITVLSTMLADDQVLGEWGFAAVVEADGHRILFDTGYFPNTVLQNAKALGVELSGVTDVILSHNHDDHTGGLVTLRTELARQNPAALSRAHVGQGIFWSRPRKAGGEGNPMVATRATYEAAGGRFIEHSGPQELAPGVWLTGPVPRIHPERNWSGKGQMQAPQGLVEDNLPEDQSLVIDTEQGLVVVTGCGHAGIINIAEAARKQVRPAPLHAVIGGLHLFRADEKVLAWTGRKLKEMKLGHLMGAHCTGIEAVFRLRELAGLQRSTCVVGAVGASFELGRGLDPLDIAR
ncbi:MBL fold metallo-hydrolase [Hyalangium gracile]|uniref:MBL fold metallo-hydrolase n=1 Tax=Hyalangium gracile TaxID=394092 RepID=UPI001CCCD581|nr:MBL fold metallo-hydrolase [Hyalangium gracile]